MHSVAVCGRYSTEVAKQCRKVNPYKLMFRDTVLRRCESYFQPYSPTTYYVCKKGFLLVEKALTAHSTIIPSNSFREGACSIVFKGTVKFGRFLIIMHKPCRNN